MHVAGLAPGQHYGWRIHGPFDPAHGYRFDGQKLLLDPYARAVAVPTTYDRWAGARRGDNAGKAMKGVVADLSRYDWEGDRPLRRPSPHAVIYEMHVKGFTFHESSGVAAGRRGTFAGLVEKIPYLRDLGVTAVELMPVFQFDAQDAHRGAHQLLGLLAGLLLRAARALRLGRDAARARSTSSATWSRRCTGPASR